MSDNHSTPAQPPPAGEPAIVVRYSPMRGWAMVAGGGVVAALGVLTIVIGWGGSGVPLVIGLAVLTAAFGGIRLKRPYFSYDPSTRVLTMRALAGPARWRFSAGTKGHLSYREPDIVMVDSGGGTRKVPVRRRMAHPDDWREVTTNLGTDRPR